MSGRRGYETQSRTPARETEEERRKKIEEERLKRLNEERSIAEAKQRDEEIARRAIEQERLQAEEKQRLERKLRMEEDRRKQLEQQAREAEEERRRVQEARIIQQEAEEKVKSEAIMQVSIPQVHQPTYDLLGGGADEDDVNYHNSENQQDSYSDYNSVGSEVGSWQGSYMSYPYRDTPSRGSIDDAVDDALDKLQPLILSVTRQGKQDGTYLFGTRIMKTQLKNSNPVVMIGSNSLTIEDYVNKFSKVESVKLRGLQSALPLCSMMGRGGGHNIKVT